MWYGLSGPRDWIIVHNRVLHTVDMPHGVNGFRYWRSPYSRRHHAVCHCGWRPDLGKHYHMRGIISMKCIDVEITREDIDEAKRRGLTRAELLAELLSEIASLRARETQPRRKNTRARLPRAGKQPPGRWE
jgi:hypothetical protein